MRKTKMYNLEYWCGKKKIQTPVVNMTKGFCGMKRKELLDSGRFSMGEFKLKQV